MQDNNMALMGSM